MIGVGYMNLKKLTTLTLSTIMILSTALFAFTGCEKNESGAENATPEASAVTTEIPEKEVAKENWNETAKIIILSGQSNMAGASYKAYLRNNESLDKEEKKQLIGAGFPNIQIMFSTSSADAPEDQWHTSNGRFVKVVAGQGAASTKTHFGPELGLADYLDEKYPGEKFYIVKHALGGSFIDEYLGSPLPDRCDSYAALTKIMDLAIPAVEADSGLKAEVVAFCWMQGESDAFHENYANFYAGKLDRLVTKIRTDYAEYAPERGIAFIDATINNSGIWPCHETVNNAKIQYQTNSKLNYLIYTNEAGLTCANEPEGTPDTAHYDSMSQLKLGHLFGEKLSEHLELTFEKD